MIGKMGDEEEEEEEEKEDDRSGINVIDVAEQVEHNPQHQMIRYQTHVIVDIPTEEPALLLL